MSAVLLSQILCTLAQLFQCYCQVFDDLGRQHIGIGQMGRVLDAVLRLAKDDGDQARALAQFSQDMAVMGFECVAVALEQALPAQL